MAFSLSYDYLATQNKNQSWLFIFNLIFSVLLVVIVSANCIKEVTLKQSGASLLPVWKQTLSFWRKNAKYDTVPPVTPSLLPVCH